jgi:hypothetical protein
LLNHASCRKRSFAAGFDTIGRELSPSIDVLLQELFSLWLTEYARKVARIGEQGSSRNTYPLYVDVGYNTIGMHLDDE